MSLAPPSSSTDHPSCTDLILWDSRQIHYNKVPSSGKLRAVMYVCYTPASFASSKDLEEKALYFKERVGTTHWP